MATPSLTCAPPGAHTSAHNPAPATLQESIEEQRDRLFQAQALVMLSNDRLRGFSGDEDALEIVSELSTISFAMDGAKKLMDGIAEALEIAGRMYEQPVETEEPAQPAPGADVSLAKVHPAASVAVERLRLRMFKAMAMVDVVALSCEESDVSRRATLEAAYEVMNAVASELNDISGHNGPLDEEEEENRAAA